MSAQEGVGGGWVTLGGNPWNAPVACMPYVDIPTHTPPLTGQRVLDRLEVRCNCGVKWRRDGSCTFWRGGAGGR